MRFCIHLQFTPMETIEFGIPEVNAQEETKSDNQNGSGKGTFTCNSMETVCGGYLRAKEARNYSHLLLLLLFCYFSICRITLRLSKWNAPLFGSF